MKALVYYGPRDIRVSEVEDPKPKKGEVLIRVVACGICGSDVHGYLGITGRRIPPMIMGHEFTGIVEDTGEEVTNVSIGDRVTVYPTRFCGVCSFCKTGLTNLCINRSVLGVMNVNGAMAEYVAVPQDIVIKLSAHIDFIKGTLLEPLGVVYRAVKIAPNLLNNSILITGAGTIGLLLLQLVKLAGANPIIVTDINQSRLNIAKKLGADIVLNPEKKEDLRNVLSELNIDGIDTAFEAVGIESTVNQILTLVKNRGTCILIGNSQRDITINMQNIVTRELKIYGSYTYTLEEFKATMNIIDKINTGEMISKVVSLEEAPKVFDELTQKNTDLLKVIIRID